MTAAALPAQAGAADEMPAPAYAPLSAVAVSLATGQALVFDEALGKYRLVMVGDLVGDWKVVSIQETRVVVTHGDDRDELALVPPPRPIEGARLPKNTPVILRPTTVTPGDLDPAPTPAPAPAPVKPKPVEDATAPRKVSRQELNRELNDFDRLGAAVDVSLAAGGGFMLSRVEAASWPYRMGLRAGDVIRSVAGERVAGVEDAARVYARLRATRAFTIELDRPMVGIVDDGDPPTTRVVLQYYVK